MRLYARIRFEERRDIDWEEIKHRAIVRRDPDDAASQTGIRCDFVLHPGECLLDLIHMLIQDLARRENYDLIVQDAVYVSPRVDITDKVLKALK